MQGIYEDNNAVIRGAVFEVEERPLCERAESEFEVSTASTTLAVAELRLRLLIEVKT